jgi:glucoamylase
MLVDAIGSGDGLEVRVVSAFRTAAMAIPAETGTSSAATIRAMTAAARFAPRPAPSGSTATTSSSASDATTGYEKSVSNLSWSYASFLSAVRARTAI